MKQNPNGTPSHIPRKALTLSKKVRLEWGLENEHNSLPVILRGFHLGSETQLT